MGKFKSSQMSLVDGGKCLFDNIDMKKTLRTISGIILTLILIFSSHSAQAQSQDRLKVFLLSCAYGTAAGALLGVASLAFSEDPGSKLNQVARGASYGLYAGIGMGLYFVYGQQSTNQDVQLSPLIITPQYAKNQIEGIKGQVTIYQF
ncbi:MAG: hypothetical protein BroJett040_12410 [Oligoflexia bacterium]|nr:MAG: hypothetical protein BroJett040_12410 [Oligoflexia bacterium]